MTDERPVSFQRKKSKKRQTKKQEGNERVCIIHNPRNTEENVVPLTSANKNRILEYYQIHNSCTNQNEQIEDILRNFPDELDCDRHGFHRYCYQRFTVLTRKERRDIHTKDKVDNDDDDDLEQPSRPKKKRTAGPQATSVLLPSDKCIVCDQRRKYVPHLKQYEYKLVKCETKEAEKSIRGAAVEKQNFSVLGRIEGLDLVAREAYYHERCRRELVRDIKRHQGRDASFSRRNEAHREAMEHVCQYIEEHIIQKAQVERMTMILERFLGYLQQHAPEHYNPNYRTRKLKEKLIHHFGERIKFWSPNSRSDLIYSTELPLGQAVELAFVAAASESRRLNEAACILRRVVLDAFRERDPDPWPPTAESLLSAHSSVGPEALVAFLKTLLCGKKTKGESQNRVASSVAQDICYSLSNERWKQPKHIALAMTIRHFWITGTKTD